VQQGTVRWFDPERGFGFLAPEDGSADLFVHASEIVGEGGTRLLREGQVVEFEVGEGERGPQAEHVVPLGAGAGQATAAEADGADGTVSWYDEEKGFGFVTPDAGGEDVFVHAKALAEGLTWLTEGDRVAYEVVQGDRGPQARDLHLVHSAVAEAAPPPAAPARDAPARPGEGVVARYDAVRGFGFITPDAGGADLFVHLSVLGGAEPLQKGERVRFTIRQSDRGPQADKVERV
jgi:CspA family cold shock protein